MFRPRECLVRDRIFLAVVDWRSLVLCEPRFSDSLRAAKSTLRAFR